MCKTRFSRRLKPMAVAFLGLVLLLAVLNTSSLTHASSSTASKVSAGIYLVNVPKFELSSGSYDLDFYLWFIWSGNQTLNYEFMNGRASSIDILQSEEGIYNVRVRGTFIKNLNFRNYPFDRHRLTIEIEDKLLTQEELEFVPDYEGSGIDSEINIAGWNIEEWKIDVVKHNYPGELTYSRLVFSFTIARSTSSSVLKSIVPIAIITTIAMLAFLISPSNYGQRIGLGVTALMSAVANHLALMNQIPPIGYLTLADKIMITAYGMFLYSLMTSVMLMRLVDQKRTESALKMNRKAGLFAPIFAFALLAVLIFIA